MAVEMLMADADLALHDITALFAADNIEVAARVVRSTRETYELIRAKRKNLTMSVSETAALNEKMDRLRARLKFLGEQV